MTIARIRTTRSGVIEACATVGDAIELMLWTGVESLVVVSGDGRPIGVVTEIDLLAAATPNERRGFGTRPITDLMRMRVAEGHAA